MFEAETRAVALAESQLELAAERLNKAAAAIGNADGRLCDLDRHRQEIVSLRAGGQHRPDDGAELEAIAADTEGLTSIRAALAGEHAVALQGHAEAQARAHSAAFALGRVKDAAAHRALVEHTDKLFSLLGASLAELSKVGARLGHGQMMWKPDPVIAMVIHKSDLMRAGVR